MRTLTSDLNRPVLRFVQLHCLYVYDATRRTLHLYFLFDFHVWSKMSYNYDMCAFRLSCFKIDNGKSIWNVNGFHSFPCTWLNAARWRAASTRRDACRTRTERIKRFMDEPFWSLPRLALKDQGSSIFELWIMEVIKVNKGEWIQFCISRIKAYMNFSAFVLSIWSLCSYLNIVGFYKIIILAILMWYACGISFPSQTKDTSVWRCTCLTISAMIFPGLLGLYWMNGIF